MQSLDKDIWKEYMKKQYTFSRHKKLTRSIPRRKVLSLRIDHTWAADLIEISSLISYGNSGFSQILNVVDLFSRKMFARPLKNKTKTETKAAMQSIVEENNMQSPYKLWTDEGKRLKTIENESKRLKMTQNVSK